MTDFQFRALYREQFSQAFIDPDAVWLTVDANPGYPCRVSLQDAEIGERVLALTYQHHDVESPYRASGPIFIREHATGRPLARNEIPRLLLHRQLSLRGYDNGAMMIAAAVVSGATLGDAIQEIFADPNVMYIHVHNAGPGCYNCAVERA